MISVTYFLSGKECLIKNSHPSLLLPPLTLLYDLCENFLMYLELYHGSEYIVKYDLFIKIFCVNLKNNKKNRK